MEEKTLPFMNPRKYGVTVHIGNFFRSSYVRSMGIRISNAALSFAVAVLLARLLGPEEYGRYGILLSFAMILAIPFTAGLPQALTKEIAIARVREDYGLVRVLIRMGMKAFFSIIPIVLLIAFCLFVTGYEVAGLGAGVLIAAILAPLSSADANRLAVMRGLGSAVKSQVPDMLVRPVGIMALVLLLTITVGQATALTGMIAYSLATVFGFLVGTIMVRNELKTVPDDLALNRIEKKKFFNSILTMSLLGGATTLTGNIDMLLLDRYVSNEAAGQYKVALTGLAVVVLGGNAVSAVSFTRLAEAIPTGNKERIALLSDQALKWSILCTMGVTGVVLLFGRPIITLLFGSEYPDVWKVLIILSIGFCIAFSFGQAPQIAALCNAQIPAALFIIISIGVTVGVAVFTAEEMGIFGIALASMVGNIFRFAVISLVIRIKLGINITVFGLISRALKDRSQTK